MLKNAIAAIEKLFYIHSSASLDKRFFRLQRGATLRSCYTNSALYTY